MHEYGIYVGYQNIAFDEEELEDSIDEEDEHANGSATSRSKDLTATQRQQIYEALLQRSNCGKLRRNATKIVAELFNVNRHAVWRLWRRVKQ
jgi:ArsR family metal-binding transcriptional regulator